MDSESQAVARVLDALSPTLTAEFQRIINEIRQLMESEFEKRLQDAIQQTQSAEREAADAHFRETIEDTRQSLESQIKEDLQAQFDAKLEEATRRVTAAANEDSEKARAVWETERTRMQEALDRWRAFAEVQGQLANASSQAEILMKWVRFAEAFGASIAVYTAKADGLALWKSRGNAIFPTIISNQTRDPESYFRPVAVRGRTVAAICAMPPYEGDALDFLTAALERAIELFGLRLRVPVAKPETAVAS